MFKILKTEGKARLGEFTTVKGVVKTPAFQNVATCGAIKGGLSAYDLKDIDCQVQLCNTYHLHVRPGDELVKELCYCFTGKNIVHIASKLNDYIERMGYNK